MEPASIIEVTAEEHGRTVVVRVCGEIDLGTAPKLSTALARALAGAPAAVVVEMSAVSFMGSCGLGELVTAWKTAERQGCGLVLVGVPPAVSRVLDATGLTSLFRQSPTVENALTSAPCSPDRA